MPRNCKRLALDLGTKTGWAFQGPHIGGLGIDSGTVDCAAQHILNPHPGDRFLQLEEHLDWLIDNHGRPDVVYWEEIKAHKGHQARVVYFGLLAIAQAWCAKFRTPPRMIGFAPGSIKKYATGTGAAKKRQMLDALPDCFNPTDHNEADALWILLYGWAWETGKLSK